MNRRVLALTVWLLVCARTWGEDPVQFPDPCMKAAVEESLWIVDPTPTDMLGLTSLECNCAWDQHNAISDLTGIQHAVNLQSLTLTHHRFSNLSPLSGLTELRTLVLQANQISDLSPLSGLVNLESLDLESNQVTDVSAFSGLENLSRLSLHKNPISDISPLVNMPALMWVDLRCAPLDLAAHETCIPAMYANRPGILIIYDSYIYRPRTVTIESTPGGSVTDPGEGQFTFDYDQLVRLEARADPCFVFVGWSGSYGAEQNPAYLTVDQDHQIQANFVSLLTELCVDDDAAFDPGPRDSQRSDSLENGSKVRPFDSIQEAIRVAADGMTILVRPGTYRENIDLLGKRLTLTAIDPADPHGGPCATLQGTGSGPVVRIPVGSGNDCSLTGFVITGGQGSPAGGVCCAGSSPRIANCLIVGNRCLDPEGAAVYFEDSRAVLVNCTIVDNYAGPGGAGLTLVDSDIEMTNSILWANLPTEICCRGTSDPSIRYCCVRGWWPDTGNIHADPLFSRRGSWADNNNPGSAAGPETPWAVWVDGDYHVKSEAGRWDAGAHLWLCDDATSPCVDAGDPTAGAGFELVPNGQRVNLGVYGGTNQASLSPNGP
jgi:hypothetical protein